MKPAERFTTRVESYRRHRPGYPAEIAALLTRECDLRSNSIIADIAAGTGLLSEIFLDRNYSVIAVEPNAAMREACKELVEAYPRLSCISGTAEATGLADNSVDLVTVGQAMHWFDLPRAREEFRRVLRPQGWCAVIYNNRRMQGDSFHEGYEELLREFGADYETVRGSHLTEEKQAAFFAPDPLQVAIFRNAQELTLDGLEGRILSSSYMPQPGQPRYEAMHAAMEDLFAREQKDGQVRMEYACTVAYGQLSRSTLDHIQG